MTLRYAPIACCVAAMACASPAGSDATNEPGSAAPAPKTQADARPVIVSLETRDETLRVHPGGRFSIERADGSVVAADLDIEQLARTRRDLFELYHDAYAKGGPWLDARVTPRTRSARPPIDSRSASQP